MTGNRLLQAKDFEVGNVYVEEEECFVSKSGIPYSKMQLSYEGGQFLIAVPECKTIGIQTKEMEAGYKRRTMPLILEPGTGFDRVFADVVENVYGLLKERGFPKYKLAKLGSCLFNDRVLYAEIVESVYDFANNTKYYIEGQEVSRAFVEQSEGYKANAAVWIDSIYLGEKTISIQVKLYEVSLTHECKRSRVL